LYSGCGRVFGVDWGISGILFVIGCLKEVRNHNDGEVVVSDPSVWDRLFFMKGKYFIAMTSKNFYRIISKTRKRLERLFLLFTLVMRCTSYYNVNT
jgi:hypothetical protein